MNRLTRKTVLGTMLAVTLALGAPQAFAASGGDTTGPTRQSGVSQANSWTPPEGFAREGFFGPAASCESMGRNGVAEGKWSAYLCHRDLPFTPFVHLYVKK
ncbi:hypothetical protein SUDANB1_04408 [Streptomyces sp. enrichment culture]